MKKLTIIIAALLVLVIGLSATGCKVIEFDDEGDNINLTYDFTDFTEIEIGYAFELEVVQSDDYSITISGPESMLEKVNVRKSGDRLKIEMNGWSLHFYKGIRVSITMPVLEGLDISGATRADVRGFSSDKDFNAEISGASSLDIDMETGYCEMEISGASRVKGNLTATESKFKVSGASQLELDGSGGNARMDVSGASDVDLYDYSLNDIDIEMSGASSGKINVSGRLDADLSGASSLRYTGDLTLGIIEKSGGSSTVDQR